jgi:hypothetical protein
MLKKIMLKRMKRGIIRLITRTQTLAFSGFPFTPVTGQISMGPFSHSFQRFVFHFCNEFLAFLEAGKLPKDLPCQEIIGPGVS